MTTPPGFKIVSKNQRPKPDRRLATRTQKAAWVADYRRSGLTMAAFARRQGLRYSSFAAWVLKSGRPAAPTASESTEILEITLVDGTRVRGRGVPALTALVRALRT